MILLWLHSHRFNFIMSNLESLSSGFNHLWKCFVEYNWSSAKERRTGKMTYAICAWNFMTCEHFSIESSCFIHQLFYTHSDLPFQLTRKSSEIQISVYIISWDMRWSRKKAQLKCIRISKACHCVRIKWVDTSYTHTRTHTYLFWMHRIRYWSFLSLDMRVSNSNNWKHLPTGWMHRVCETCTLFSFSLSFSHSIVSLLLRVCCSNSNRM